MAEVMASAIVVPEEARDATPDTNGNSNGLKRRQSESDEQESKRQRTSPGKSSPAAPTTEEKQQPETSTSSKEQGARDVRKKKTVGDEKQRSKRLFGALLGNLNRPSDRNATKRAEIEQRRKAELQKQDDERLEDKQKRLEQLAKHRKTEQINFDEQNMHIRHKNLLSSANYLQTRAEPRLYYKPWELLPDEEDRIEDHIRDAEKQIDKELDEWNIEKRRRLNEIEGRTEDDETQDRPSANGHDKAKGSEQADQPPNVDTNNENKNEAGDTGDSTKPAEVPESDLSPRESGQVQASDRKEEEKETSSKGATGPATAVANDEEKEEPKEDHDDDGDHVEEGDEDTVIY